MRRILVVSGLVLIGLGLALYFSLSRTEVARALAQRQPVHILWTIHLLPQDPPDLAVAVTLHPQGWVSFLLIPTDLSVPTEQGWAPLREVYSPKILADLLELTFVETVEVAPAAWENVVARVGGAMVRAETRLFCQISPEITVDLPAGEQFLDPVESREFLLYALRCAEDPRPFLSDFFQNFLARVWAKGRAAFAGLDIARTWDSQEFWRRALDVPFDKVGLDILPMIREDSRIMPDFVKLRKVREKIVSGRTFLTRDEVRIAVLNGTWERFLATRVGHWLSARGFQVVEVGSADRQDYTQTLLIVPTGAEEKAALLRGVLPEGVVQTSPEDVGLETWPKDADLVLILGGEFEVEG